MFDDGPIIFYINGEGYGKASNPAPNAIWMMKQGYAVSKAVIRADQEDSETAMWHRSTWSYEITDKLQLSTGILPKGPSSYLPWYGPLFEILVGSVPWTPFWYMYGVSVVPKGSRYLIIKELGLKDHDHYGFGGLSP